jgi:hypothetical protein
MMFVVVDVREFDSEEAWEPNELWERARAMDFTRMTANFNQYLVTELYRKEIRAYRNYI